MYKRTSHIKKFLFYWRSKPSLRYYNKTDHDCCLLLYRAICFDDAGAWYQWNLYFWRCQLNTIQDNNNYSSCTLLHRGQVSKQQLNELVSLIFLYLYSCIKQKTLTSSVEVYLLSVLCLHGLHQIILHLYQNTLNCKYVS